MVRATTVWEITVAAGQPTKLAPATIDVERALEDWIEQDPSMVEPGLRILARQLTTAGGELDLLGLDSSGRLVVVELKRAAAYREALAQVLDYAASVSLLSYDDLKEKVDVNRQSRGWSGTLDDILEDVLGEGAEEWAPDSIPPRLVLVGTGADPSLRRIVDYLTSRYDVPVNGVFFDVSRSLSGSTILVRSALVADEQAAQQGRRRGRGGVSNVELLALAKDRGVTAFVEPVLKAWAERTGRSGRPERRNYWSLAAKTDGRAVAGMLYPWDDDAEVKKAWLGLAYPKIAEDLSSSEEDVRRSLKEHGVVIEEDMWASLGSDAEVDALVKWINDAYPEA